MAYTDDGVKAKLSALNETQESIVTVAQWIMFHRRHADRTSALWLERLKDAGASKRLNLVYLANEVVQQSKARKKEDFLIAFSPIIAEATASAYKGATSEVQQKLRRVVEVWRQRQIFEIPIQDAVEARINDIDKTRSTGKKSLLGGTSFANANSSAPPELQPLVPLQNALTKAMSAVSSTSASTIESDYSVLMDPTSVSPPPPPVHAAKLSGLLKSLANAEGAVSEIIRTRVSLIASLETLLSTNRVALATEQSQQQDLTSKRSLVEAKRQEVELEIMRKLPSTSDSPHLPTRSSPANGTGNGNDAAAGVATESTYHQDGNTSTQDRGSSIEPERPQMEALTPPPASPSPTPTPAGAPTITPTGSPGPDAVPGDPWSVSDALPYQYQQPAFDLAAAAQQYQHSAPALGTRAWEPDDGTSEEGGYKRRRVEGGFTGGDLDEEVSALLRAEGGS